MVALYLLSQNYNVSKNAFWICETMDSRQLRYFAAIYEHGSLSQAAEALRVAVSALSHHLANLETELATRLFHRKPRGMQATASGERLYIHAKAILKSMSAAEKDIREATGMVAGDVAVGFAHSAVKAIGVDLARAVLEDLPKVRLSLSESLSGTTLMQLMSSEVDMALVYNAPNDPRLKVQPVLEERMVCAGRPEFLGDTDAPIRFDELLDLPMILLRQGIFARALMRDVTLLKKLEARATLQLNSVQAIMGALTEGLGCTIASTLIVREKLATGELRARPVIEPELDRTLYLCELIDQPPTFAQERVRELIMSLVRDAVRGGRWDALLV